MICAFLLVLASATAATEPSSATLEALPPLRPGPPAAMVTPRTFQSVAGNKQCHFERLTFDDPRVRAQWRTECVLAQGILLETSERSAVVGLFAQGWLPNPFFAFASVEAAELDKEEDGPSWLSPPLLARARQELTPTGQPPGFVKLGVDPRDGATLGTTWERGYLRLPKRGEPSSLFAPAWPGDTRGASSRLVFAPAQQQPHPWLFYAVELTRQATLRLRSPDGQEESLLSLPPGTPAQVEALQAVHLGGTHPVVSALVNGAWVLFTPQAQGLVGRVFAQRAPAIRPPPEGESTAPAALGPACSEQTIEQREEEFFDPKLVAFGKRVLAVYLSRSTRSALRFGVVPQGGRTPTEDRIGCEWILDAQDSGVALVLAEVTDSGELEERLRTPVKVRTGYTFHGSTNLVALERDTLTVVSSSPGFINLTVLDLRHNLVPTRSAIVGE